MFSKLLVSLPGALVQDLICPAPRGSNLQGDYKKKTGPSSTNLYMIIEEDDVYFKQCYPFIRDVRTESNTVTPRWKPLEDILKNGQSTKPSSSMRPSRQIYD
jgi:hypothetical protein